MIFKRNHQTYLKFIFKCRVIIKILSLDFKVKKKIQNKYKIKIFIHGQPVKDNSICIIINLLSGNFDPIIMKK